MVTIVRVGMSTVMAVATTEMAAATILCKGLYLLAGPRMICNFLHANFRIQSLGTQLG